MSEYDFIFEDRKQTTNGPSMLGKILVVFGGLAILGIIAAVVFGILLKPDTTSLDKLARAYAINQDIILISEEATDYLTDTNAQGLSVGSRLVLTSDGQKILELLTTSNRPVTDLELDAATDEDIREDLEKSINLNRYDAVFVESYTAKLRSYAITLQDVYRGLEGAVSKAVVEQSYNNILILIDEAPVVETPEQTPQTEVPVTN